MSGNVDETSRESLISLAELLFIPLIFHIVTKWDVMDTWPKKSLWLLLFLLIQNEYLSVKQSYKHYNIWLYFLDLGSLGVYIFALEKLQAKNTDWLMYNQDFWLVLSFIWLIYAVWDFVMLKFSPKYEQREGLFKWGMRMLVFFIISLFCAYYLSYLIDNTDSLLISMGKESYYLVVTIIHIILAGLALTSLLLWFKDLSNTFEKTA